jgi:hypothetical protein
MIMVKASRPGLELSNALSESLRVSGESGWCATGCWYAVPMVWGSRLAAWGWYSPGAVWLVGGLMLNRERCIGRVSGGVRMMAGLVLIGGWSGPGYGVTIGFEGVLVSAAEPTGSVARRTVGAGVVIRGRTVL